MPSEKYLVWVSDSLCFVSHPSLLSSNGFLHFRVSHQCLVPRHSLVSYSLQAAYALVGFEKYNG